MIHTADIEFKLLMLKESEVLLHTSYYQAI